MSNAFNTYLPKMEVLRLSLAIGEAIQAYQQQIPTEIETILEALDFISGEIIEEANKARGATHGV